jgi:FkbM family methyltransferase
MTLPSAWRYRRHVLTEERRGFQKDSQLALRMRHPIKCCIRLRESGTDFGTFSEVLVTEVYKPVLDRIGECRTFVDLGANIGLTCLYIAQRFPQCAIFALEPNQETYNLLLRNLSSLIRKGRCATLPGAAWNANSLLVPDQNNSPLGYDVFRVRKPGQTAVGNIPAYSMNEILSRSGFRSVDLLKIDIEGAETQVLSGDTSWLEAVNFIAIEFHGSSRISSGFDELMKKSGFSVCEVNQHTTFAAAKHLR